MKKVFVSYSSKDEEIARTVVKYLESNGISCWVSYRDIPMGADFGDVIPSAIRKCPAFLILLSRNSVTSRDVANELTLAARHLGQTGKMFFPLMLEDISLPDKFDYHLASAQTYRHYLDPAAAMKKVCRELQNKLEDEGRPSLIDKANNIDEMIEYMEKNGIRFEIDTKETAKEFLEIHGNILQVASYRANYRIRTETPNKGKYIDLDFAYLRELFSIDRDLRYIIMRMVLDIEHYLKVRLLRAIENNPEEDGLWIIRRFIARDRDLTALRRMPFHRTGDYCRELIEKYYPYFPAKVYVELIPLSELAELCEFYYQMYQDQIVDKVMINSVKDIRNDAAHDNSMINRLLVGNNSPHQRVEDRVRTIQGIGEKARDKKLRNKFTYDFVCLMFTYDDIVPDSEIKRSCYEEMRNLFEVRMLRHKDWFEKNNNITSTYDFCKKVLDSLM